MRRIYYICCQHCGREHIRHRYPCEVPDCPGSVVYREGGARSEPLTRRPRTGYVGANC
jgi:hypothetical protein